MCHFTFVIYAPEMATLHVDAKEWGWTLVGYASSLPSEPRDDDAWLGAAGVGSWPEKLEKRKRQAMETPHEVQYHR